MKNFIKVLAISLLFFASTMLNAEVVLELKEVRF